MSPAARSDAGVPEPAGGGDAPDPGRLPFEYLRRALARGRLSHAYLLLGPEGSGKREFARELARLVFCERPVESPVPRGCGSCPSCRQVEHGNHPGVEAYGPPEGRSWIDIDTVRALCERSHYARSHAFLALIEGADLLTRPAANALLKTLEEPGGEFVLVLTAPAARALLPTIVSRCHRLHFPARPAALDDRVDPEELELARRPGFHARHDTRAWLARAVPGESSSRERVRALVAELLRREREALGEAAEEALDAGVDRVETLLDLRAALDGNASPDLVLERLLARCLR